MTNQRRSRESRAKECWIQEIRDINITITRLEGERSGWWCVTPNWTALNRRIRKLVKRFYLHCLDYVVLTDFRQLVDYGEKLCFENCSIMALLEFLRFFPAFPSRHEWLQSVDLYKLVDKLIPTHLL